jgi:hypothetical protein
LLVEWTDQPQELGQIYYQSIDAENLGEGVALKNHVAHLITTEKALTGYGSQDLAIRLYDYRPRRTRVGSYYLLPEWATFGLRVFIPRRSDVERLQKLELYPDMRPGAESAQRLAAAFGIDRQQMTDRCVLLSELDGDHLNAAVLPVRGNGSATRGFRRLTGSVDWKCTLDVNLTFPQGTQPTASAAASQLFRSIGDELAAAVRSLQPHLDDCRTRVTATRERVDGVTGRITRIEEEQQTTGTALETVQQRLEQLGQDIAALDGTSERLSEMHAQLSSLTSRLENLRREYEQASGTLEQVLADIRG